MEKSTKIVSRCSQDVLDAKKATGDCDEGVSDGTQKTIQITHVDLLRFGLVSITSGFGLAFFLAFKTDISGPAFVTVTKVDFPRFTSLFPNLDFSLGRSENERTW